MRAIFAAMLALGLVQGAAAAAAPATGVRLGDMVGAEVVDRAGERVGVVEDIVVDTARDRVAHATVALPGPLGLGRRSVWLSIPRDAEVEAGGRLVVDAPRGLADAPLAAPPRRWGAGRHSASELLEARVEDFDGRDVGELRDIVVNPRDGAIEYAVIEVDDGLFEPARIVAVDMPAVRRERVGSNDLVLTANRREIDAAPAIAGGGVR